MKYESILKAASELAAKRGFANLTRLGVSMSANVAAGTVNYHFKTMRQLRSAVLDHAIENRLFDVLAKAWAEGLLRNRKVRPSLIDAITAHITSKQ